MRRLVDASTLVDGERLEAEVKDMHEVESISLLAVKAARVTIGI